MTREHRDQLLEALARAHRRAQAALPSSPEWEAAEGMVDELELELDALGSDDIEDHRLRRTATKLEFGPMSLPDHVTVEGTIVGRPDRIWALRARARELADVAVTRQQFTRELDRLATRTGFVQETGAMKLDPIRFYLWDAGPEAGDRRI